MLVATEEEHGRCKYHNACNPINGVRSKIISKPCCHGFCSSKGDGSCQNHDAEDCQLWDPVNIFRIDVQVGQQDPRLWEVSSSMQ